ncbi:MAG TPA: serine hydrolase domain-containing protein [Steroidobacteraceae bacterium]|nr:serine hydrolase domain-containing protein [Steroidobacteraceae bacterium]
MPELLEWARASQNAPALAAVVIRHGQVIEKGAVGLRSAEASVHVTADDLWHLGSITKSMTATLAGILVEDGLIDWDTRPVDVWPELSTRIHSGFRDITLRQLLSHTSGLKRDDEFSPASNNAPGTLMQKRRAWAEEVLSQKPEHTAGTFSYSNIGYMVAGAMLETRAGLAYEALLTNRVFAPLGMTHSGFGTPGTPGALDQPLGHSSHSSGFDPVQPTAANENILAITPAGLVHVSLDDFAAYLQAHLDGERGNGGLLTSETFHTLHTAVAPGYAMGWEVVSNLQGLNAAGFGHNGSNLRWFAQTWFSPSADAGVLVVTNGGGERGQAAVIALDQLLRARIAATP